MTLTYDSEADAIYVRLRDVEPGSVRVTRELGVSEGVSLEGVPHAGEIREAMGPIGALASAG